MDDYQDGIMENEAMAIVSELEKGEKSGMVENFDREEHLNRLHAKYVE